MIEQLAEVNLSYSSKACKGLNQSIKMRYIIFQIQLCLIQTRQVASMMTWMIWSVMVLTEDLEPSFNVTGLSLNSTYVGELFEKLCQ